MEADPADPNGRVKLTAGGVIRATGRAEGAGIDGCALRRLRFLVCGLGDNDAAARAEEAGATFSWRLLTQFLNHLVNMAVLMP